MLAFILDKNVQSFIHGASNLTKNPIRDANFPLNIIEECSIEKIKNPPKILAKGGQKLDKNVYNSVIEIVKSVVPKPQIHFMCLGM